MEEKKLIRKQIFKLRKECTDSQVEAWSRQIAQKVAELPEFQSAQKILAYADYNHEVMTGFIIEEAWKQGKEVKILSGNAEPGYHKTGRSRRCTAC